MKRIENSLRDIWDNIKQIIVENFPRQETQEKEKTYNNKPKTIKKIVIGTYISIITLGLPWWRTG